MQIKESGAWQHFSHCPGVVYDPRQCMEVCVRRGSREPERQTLEERGHVIELVMIEFIDTHSPNHLPFKGPLSNGHGLQEGRWISRIVSVG